MEYIKLKNVAQIYLGLTHTPKYVECGVPFLSVKDISGGKIDFSKCHYIENQEFESLPQGAKPQRGDLLFCRVGTIGKPIIIDEAIPKFGTFVSLGFLRCINSEYTLEYLKYWMNSKLFYKQVKQNVKGVAQINLNTGWLKEFLIPVRTIKEQREIVKKLDKIQEIIDIRNKQIEELDILIKSQFVKMFGNILEYEKLEKYAVLITKGASPKWQGINYQNDGTLFVTSENVREGFVDISKPKYLDNKINEILPRSILKRDDILINIVGASIGRAAKYDYDYLANINQAVALVRTQNINNVFLLAYLNSDEAIKMYDDMKKGGARENLSLKNIADLRIPKTPIELQNQFAEIVKQIDKQKFEIQKSLEEIQKLQESLMNKYFGG